MHGQGQWQQHAFSISAHSLYCASFFSPPSRDDDEELSPRLVSILDEALVATNKEAYYCDGGFCDTCLSISPFPPHPFQFLSFAIW